MRLFLAVAVLVLAFVAYTEAQEETIDQKLNKFGQQVSDAFSNFAETAKAKIEEINRGQFMTESRDWIGNAWTKFTEKLTDATQ